MARIYWDTNLFIYLFEADPRFAPRVLEIRESMNSHGDILLSSAFTLGELLVHPLREGNQVLADRFRDFFSGGALEVIAFDNRVADWYGRICAGASIDAGDAIHLACAAAAGADLFLTNDERLSRRTIPGVRFISSLRNAPL